MVKNAKCIVSDSTVCKWMNKECKECYIAQVKSESDALKMLESFEVTLSLLPDKFDELQEQDCCFCKQQKNPRVGYAVIDLAHSEPEYKKGMFFGLGKKVKQKVGSLMVVSVSVCKECRKVLRTTEHLKWLLPALMIVISLGVILIPSVGKAMSAMHSLLSYGVVISASIIGYVLGKVLSRLYVKSKEQKMFTDVLEVPGCREMINNGWFSLQADQSIRFSKKSMTSKVADLGKTDKEPKEDFTQTTFLVH